MIIKASGITNLTDARYFAAKGVAFMGFNLVPDTPFYLDPIYLKAIREWVEGPVITGEFGALPYEQVSEYCSFLSLDAAQMAPPIPSAPKAFDVLTEILVAPGFFPPAMELIFEKSAPFTKHFIVNAEALDWQNFLDQAHFWKTITAQYSCLLQLAAPADAYPALRDAIAPAGFCFRGSSEVQTGVKSFDELEEAFDALGIY